MKSLEEKTIKTEPVFSGRIIRLQVDEVELPNGNTSTREIVKHPGAVAVIPITSDNKIVMVEQYRKPMEKVLVEIPAGKLEKGEDPAYTAARELEEETGYESQSLEWLISFYTSPGFADEIVHLYVAKGLTKKENAASLDEDEFVNVLEVTLEEAIEFVKEQRVYDAKTAYAIQYLQLQEALKK
ncbi:NUDIX hydrolase [Robertmurraya sp. DFI.2.37]|uniref:NUDIX domain-containing protein n=1 Tax=Robertmurraya sp. DFI.2.37 TaxID=3031819 RepID=UPI00177EFDB8|nr:NUDIX hydrolase [Robertmurraya sp. DFI.2.37]MDF1507497.1 NUDIX hydrolase [Robertmurraya sp. DFI.2.37]